MAAWSAARSCLGLRFFCRSEDRSFLVARRKRQVGDAMQKSTPTHWLLLEATDSKYMPLLEWWIEIGRHRIRQTTGDDILQLGVPTGPQIAQLLRTAQHIAWEGGTAEDESEAVRSALSNGLVSVKKT